MAFFENGDYRAAATAFDVAVSAKPDYGFAHYFRGRSLLMLEQSADADRAFTLAFEKDPSMRSRISWRGLARVQLPGQARAAVEDAETALALDGATGDDRWRCARVYALAASAMDQEAAEKAKTDDADVEAIRRLSQEYAVRSVDLLRQCLEEQAIETLQLQSDSLDFLREREDFQALTPE